MNSVSSPFDASLFQLIPTLEGVSCVLLRTLVRTAPYARKLEKLCGRKVMCQLTTAGDAAGAVDRICREFLDGELGVNQKEDFLIGFQRDSEKASSEIAAVFYEESNFEPPSDFSLPRSWWKARIQEALEGLKAFYKSLADCAVFIRAFLSIDKAFKTREWFNLLAFSCTTGCAAVLCAFGTDIRERFWIDLKMDVSAFSGAKMASKRVTSWRDAAFETALELEQSSEAIAITIEREEYEKVEKLSGSPDREMLVRTVSHAAALEEADRSAEIRPIGTLSAGADIGLRDIDAVLDESLRADSTSSSAVAYNRFRSTFDIGLSQQLISLFATCGVSLGLVLEDFRIAAVCLAVPILISVLSTFGRKTNA